MEVKFIDLSWPTQKIKKEFLVRADAFLDRANFILTDEVKQFENEWKTYVGTEHALGVSNGGDALWLALTALGVGSGDEVITQGNAYNASVTAILRAGAVPRFADIDPRTLLIDPAKIEPLITPKTKAILPVHLYGQASDMTAIMAIAKKHKLFIVEDCAQAHGAEWQGKKVGSWGDVGAWSFYPTKNLGAFGDAGAITTSDANVAEEIRMLRTLGQAAKNDHQRLGYNMRLDALQAIALSLKLKYLGEATEKRRTVADFYDKAIAAARLPVQVAHVAEGATNVRHLYPIRILKGDRDAVREALKKRGVQTEVHYPVIPMEQPFYPKDLPHDPCPVAEAAAASLLSLPLHESITNEEQEYVTRALREVLSDG